MPRHHSIIAALLAATALADAARASHLTVPDDVATVQGALDARVDTVLVRAGSYAESPTMVADVHLMGIPGDPAFEQPVLAGVSLYGKRDEIGALTFHGLTFGEQVHIYDTATGSSVAFEDCSFMAGINDGSPDHPASYETLRRCRIVGDARLAAEGHCTLDSCNVAGHLIVSHDLCALLVERSEFHGDGTGTAIGPPTTDLNSATVRNTLIEGFSLGIAVFTESEAVLEDDTIRDCGSGGILVDGGGGRLIRNRVERCGYGVWAGSGLVAENVVTDCGGTGILVAGDGSMNVTNNVVTGCGLEGIHIGGWAPAEVTNNTSAFNAGSGFVSDCVVTYTEYHFVGNIGFANGRYGIEWGLPDVTTVRCNDWFGNVQGAVQGLPPSPDDLALDPRFCDAGNGDFRLATDSPLVDAPGCGQVGALGVGCATASVPPQHGFRLAAVRPSPSTGPVTIEYELGRDAGVDIDVFDVQGRRVASLARGPQSAGPHTVVWPASVRGGLFLVRYRYPGGEDRRRLVLTR